MIFLFYCLIFNSAGVFPLAGNGVLLGVVREESGAPVHDARAVLVELKRSVRADAEGRFRFEKLPAGDWTLQVESRDFGTRLQKVAIEEGRESKVTVIFDITVHESLTISATPNRKSISDVSQAVGVLNGDDLLSKLEGSLGETLAREPGVSATSFGAAASRPVIRGLGGDRIRVLEGGIGTGDVSSTSADHAVSVDTNSAQRIEILRGPASLRYGSSAVGGVINVLDGRIPETVPATRAGGTLSVRVNSGAEERTVFADLEGGKGHIAWHLDGVSAQTEEYEIPEPGEEGGHELFSGRLVNSDTKSRKSTIGVSYITDHGFLGFAYSRLRNDYGVPGHAEHEDQAAVEEEEVVRIDMDQERFDLRGELRFAGIWRTLGLRLGGTDYQHVELEGDQIGTRFFNDYLELRSEATHGAAGLFSGGSVGVQYSARDFVALGEEAFVPPNEANKLAVFAFEEIERVRWNLSLGLRYETQTNRADPIEGIKAGNGQKTASGREANLSFDGISASIGLIYGRDQDTAYSVNVTRSERAPTPEELFSDGTHLATSSYELGNRGLHKEASLGLDLVLRRKVGPITGELSLFSNRFDDYIYQRFSGNKVEGLREYVFAQGDARFHGGELHADATILHSEPHHLHFEVTYDFVRAKLSSGENLPRMTPSRLGLRLEYKQPHLKAAIGVWHSEEQKRVADLEEPTDGYTLLNANFGYRLPLGAGVHHLLLKGTNLTDTAARNHISFLKDRVLLPGRNLSLTYQLSF